MSKLIEMIWVTVRKWKKKEKEEEEEKQEKEEAQQILLNLSDKSGSQTIFKVISCPRLASYVIYI